MGDNTDLVYRDRLEALQTGGEELLEAALGRLPFLADTMAGTGPLTLRPGYSGLLARHGGSQGPLTRQLLASALAGDLGLQLSVLSTTRIEHQLLGWAVWQGGVLEREATVGETGADPEVLDRAATGLAEMFLSDPTRGWVALRPGVEEWVSLPGVMVRGGADLYTSDQLARILADLGVRAGTRKAERVAALEAALRDRTVVEAAIDRLDPEANSAFRRLARLGRASLWEMNVGLPYHPNSLLQRLARSGLVGYYLPDEIMWVWLDVLVTLNGRLYEDWSEPSPTPRPLAAVPERIPAVVGHLDRLLQRWSLSPPAALKSGGLGVKPVRAAAKSLGVDSTQVGLVASLAIELGLLGPVITSTRGRGRNATVDAEWRPTERWEEWRGETTGRRWASLVQRWLDSDQIEVTGKAVERYEAGSPGLGRPFSRVAYLEALAGLEEGWGLTEDDLSSWLGFLYPSLMAPSVVSQLTGEARALGLVTADGPVGLTPVGRRLLEGVEELETLSDGSAAHFTVQADHTVIAPPDLDPDVATGLERFARLESEAGARIYRIGGDEVIAALDSGESVEEILEFLAHHSTVAIPQNVERTVRDAGDRHGTLLVGTAPTWVTSHDPAFLAQAVAVRAAKLEAVSPTLAVSTLPPDKVAEALRRRGLAPRQHTAERAPVRTAPRRRAPAELRERPLRSREDKARLAASLTDGPDRSGDARGGRDWDSELAELIPLFREDE